MRAIISPGIFSGTFRIPASKSHTIRRLIIASLAQGTSIIDYPLDSLDTQSCVSVCRSLGADIELQYADDDKSSNSIGSEKRTLSRIVVKGLGIGAGGSFTYPEHFLDVGNSGTTLFLMLAIAALGTEALRFTGDAQMKKRSAGALLNALEGLGVKTLSENENANDCVPLSIRGPMKGGRISVSCPTSQYLSALLLAAPLAPTGTITEIDVPLLNEKPYITMTLAYLNEQGVRYKCSEDYSYFKIEGGSVYKPINGPVPGDFSSAAFPACAAAISGGTVSLLGLDPHDTQGDKKVFDILKQYGCNVEWKKSIHTTDNVSSNKKTEWECVISRTDEMRGLEIDLNDTPDMLPALASVALYASGKTVLVNVAHARIKETDRVAVMARELSKLGANIEERPDGLIIHGKTKDDAVLRGGNVKGHDDHRVVMALAIAALGADASVEIAGAECVDVTYPGFLKLLNAELKE